MRKVFSLLKQKYLKQGQDESQLDVKEVPPEVWFSDKPEHIQRHSNSHKNSGETAKATSVVYRQVPARLEEALRANSNRTID